MSLKYVGAGLQRASDSQDAFGSSGALVFNVTGKPTASQVLWRGYIPFAFNIVSGSSGGTAKTAATASTVLTLKRAGTTIMTWTWAAGATVPTVSVSVSNPAAGNFTLEAQTTPDTTLEDPSPTAFYTRT